ncbi:MAG TPA: threonine/serine dehydratase [Candidatus Dormibacteraeota bacterium]|nr:threonine/serine dehydratase [Candidatus Dormibacteraeota bacterium]
MVVESEVLSLADFRAAAGRIRPHIFATPTLSGEAVGGPGVWLKAENLQRTGSFKVRGAVNAVLQLSPEQRRRGVITLSAGNHGMALAWAAATIGASCVVVIRDDAPPAKLQAIRGYGAEVILVPIAEWQQRLEEEQQRRNLTLVHPFDDPAVVAGQGTVGLEVLEAVPDIRTMVVPVGGGGLIAGISLALKQQRKEIRLIGVEPEGAPVVSEGLAAGRPVVPSRLDTVAEALAPPYTRPFTLGIIQRYVDEMRLISDAAIIEALKVVALKSKLVLEPGGAAAVAALLADTTLPRPAVALLSGANVDGQKLGGWLAT